MRRLLFFGGILFFSLYLPVKARVGVILMESIPGTAGYISQGGHSAIFLSETCTDDFVSLRPCTGKDPVWGVTVERTASFSQKAKYDWLAMPVAFRFFALSKKEKAPLIVNRHIRKKLIQNFYFNNSLFRNMVTDNDPEFEKGMEIEKNYGFPKGRWQNFFGARLRRSLYVVWINDRSGGKERELVEAINGFSNRPKYSTLLFLFAGNCSKWVKKSLLQIDELKEAGIGQNIWGDGFFSSPKGITEETFNAARKIMAKNSDVFVTVEFLPQIPGTFPQSEEPFYVIESVFRNKLVYPAIAYFHPIVFLVGRFYFKFIKDFSIQKKYRSYFSLEVAGYTEKNRKPGAEKSVNRRKIDRLRDSFFGSKYWWNQKKKSFQRILQGARDSGLIGSINTVKKGKLLKKLLDEKADLEFDPNGNPRLVQFDGEEGKISTGLTLETVSDGNLKLGFQIMLARINWQFELKKRDRRLGKETFQKEWDKLTHLARSLDLEKGLIGNE
jgi:hypothetical protein